MQAGSAVAGLDTQRADMDEIIRYVGYVPQQPGALLFQETLDEELSFTRRGHHLRPDPAADRALLERLGWRKRPGVTRAI